MNQGQSMCLGRKEGRVLRMQRGSVSLQSQRKGFIKIREVLWSQRRTSGGATEGNLVGG